MLEFTVETLFVISPIFALVSGISVFMLYRSALWRRIAYVSASVGILGIPLSIIAAGATAQLFAANFIRCTDLLCSYFDSIFYGSLIGLILSMIAGLWFARSNVELKGVRLWVTTTGAIIAALIFAWFSYVYYVAILPS